MKQKKRGIFKYPCHNKYFTLDQDPIVTLASLTFYLKCTTKLILTINGKFGYRVIDCKKTDSKHCFFFSLYGGLSVLICKPFLDTPVYRSVSIYNKS